MNKTELIVHNSECIMIGGMAYELSNDKLRDFSTSCNYVKSPGKTEIFHLYESVIKTKDRNMILFSKDSYESWKEAPKQTIIAKKRFPWKWNETILSPENMASLIIPRQFSRAHVRKILRYDSMTESDSLRLFNYLVMSPITLPSEVWPVLLLWLIDEINHYKGFDAVYKQIFVVSPEEQNIVDNEVSDFTPLNGILNDPFKLFVGLTYDEAATINAYQNDMPVYNGIGNPMKLFVEKVKSDEGWHFSKFANITAKYYSHRLGDLDSVLNEVSNLDGKKYARTFFLDHDPSVEAQFDNNLRLKAMKMAKKTILFHSKRVNQFKRQ